MSVPPMSQPMRVVTQSVEIEPRRVVKESWWCDASQTGFTAQAEQRRFRDVDAVTRERRRRRITDDRVLPNEID